jgi:hypothetical protein
MMVLMCMKMHSYIMQNQFYHYKYLRRLRRRQARRGSGSGSADDNDDSDGDEDEDGGRTPHRPPLRRRQRRPGANGNDADNNDEIDADEQYYDEPPQPTVHYPENGTRHSSLPSPKALSDEFNLTFLRSSSLFVLLRSSFPVNLRDFFAFLFMPTLVYQVRPRRRLERLCAHVLTSGRVALGVD